MNKKKLLYTILKLAQLCTYKYSVNQAHFGKVFTYVISGTKTRDLQQILNRFILQRILTLNCLIGIETYLTKISFKQEHA